MLTRLRTRFALATVAGLALVAVVVLMLAGGGPDCGEPFDASAWRAARAVGLSATAQLQDAAVKIAHCGTFTGKPASEVQAELGEPTMRSAGFLSYSLAATSPTDWAWLEFTLDRSGRVVEASPLLM